jgi:hypothetical protein
LSEGYCSCLKVFNSHALPLFGYPIKPFGSVTNILEFGKVLHSPNTSFYNNIINHETKELFLTYLFHAHYIIPDILIQVNEGIAKFFTLMV